MDFTKKDARGAAEVPMFCALRWPETGEPIMDGGKPVGVMVLGAMARSVQATLRDEARAKMQAAKGKLDDETRALEDIQRDFVKSASRLTTSFVNVQRGDRDAVAPDDCEWFYDLNLFSTASLTNPKDGWQGQSFAQQVLSFSNDAANYLGNG